MATADSLIHGGFQVTVSDRAPEMILPQQMGRALWKPMLIMAVMAFPIAAILGIVRALAVADGDQQSTVAALGQFVPAVMFLGIASVFAAIVFAIARILGTLRTGGGQVQETAGRRVLTLKMPATAKAMIGFMMMAMMMLVFAVIVHIILGIAVADAVNEGKQSTIDTVDSWATWIEGLRRFGVALYLISAALGLATIIRVLRFQSQRVRELPGEEASSPSS